jgi:translation initiation factor 2 beta subunit (eIF-2beta)/eIF-5
MEKNKNIELIGVCKFLYGNKNIQLTLPSDFDKFLENLVEQNGSIIINDDMDGLTFDNFDDISSENIKNNINQYLNNNNREKIKFPMLQINYEPNKIIWLNFNKYNILLNNIDKNIEKFKYLSLIKTIFPYIAFSYGIEDMSNIYIHDEKLYVSIKTKKLKTKIEKVIQAYFKTYHYCLKCKEISSMLIKFNASVQKICMNCGDRIVINDPWISNLK